MATLYWDYTLGDDTTGDGSYALPYKTADKCSSTGGNGTTCLLKNGTHTLTGTFSQVISEDDIIIGSESGDASLAIIDGNDANYAAWQITGNSLTVQDITFKKQSYANSNNLIKANGNTLIIRNCVFEEMTSVATGEHMLNPNSGVADITVTGNVFWNCRSTSSLSSLVGSGTGVTSGTVYIDSNTFVGDSVNDWASTVVYFGGAGAIDITMTNNIIVHRYSGTQRLLSVNAAASATTIFNNNCYFTSGGAQSLVNVGTEENNITDDPLFVSEATGFFALKPTSPCIDAGTVV